MNSSNIIKAQCHRGVCCAHAPTHFIFLHSVQLYKVLAPIRVSQWKRRLTSTALIYVGNRVIEQATHVSMASINAWPLHRLRWTQPHILSSIAKLYSHAWPFRAKRWARGLKCYRSWPALIKNNQNQFAI